MHSVGRSRISLHCIRATRCILRPQYPERYEVITYDRFRHGKRTKRNGDDMKNSSDTMRKKYKDMDFADAKPASAVPPLAKLQAESGRNCARPEGNIRIL